MIKTHYSLSSLATQATTYATRGVVALGLPAYFILRMHPGSSPKIPDSKLITASLIILSAPTTLICALGVIEGTVRSCAKLAKYCFQRNQEEVRYHWDQFCKEITTTHGLIRGAFSPISGYSIIVNEWQKQGPVSKTGSPRIIKEEYLVYRSLRAFGRGIVEVGRQVLNGLHWICTQIIWAIQTTWNVARYLGNKSVDVARTTWKIIQPTLTMIRNAILNGIKRAWHATQPLRTFVLKVITKCMNAIKWIIWDFAIKTVLIDWFFTRVIWNIGVKIILEKIVWPPIKFIATKIIWDFVIKKVLVDWFLTQLIWNVGVKIILKQVIWPPIKFTATQIIWPVLKTTGEIVRAIILFAFSVIAWTTQQAFRLGR